MMTVYVARRLALQNRSASLVRDPWGQKESCRIRPGRLVVTRGWARGGTLAERLRPQESVSDSHDIREPGEQLQQIRLGVPAEECGEELACDGPLAQHGRAADVPQRHDGGEQTGLLELGHTVGQEPSGDQ